MITGTPSDLDINGPPIVESCRRCFRGDTDHIVMVVSGKSAAATLGSLRYTGDNSAAKINVVHFIGKSLLGILNTLRDILGTHDVGSSKFTGAPTEAVLVRPISRLPSISSKRKLVITRALLSNMQRTGPFERVEHCDPAQKRSTLLRIRSRARMSLRKRARSASFLLPDSSCCEWCRPEWPAW